MSRRLRVAIAGTGFIGAVHARSARLAGARLVGVAASTPGARPARGRGPRGRPCLRHAPSSWSRRPTWTSCTSARPTTCTSRSPQAALAAGKHVICEKPIALDGAGAQALDDAADARRADRGVPFVYRYYPTVREARERVRTGVSGPIRLLHGSYLQDWLLRPEDDNWRVDARSAAPRARSPTSAATGATSPSSSPATASRRLSARTLTALPGALRERGARRVRSRPTATARRRRSRPRTPR